MSCLDTGVSATGSCVFQHRGARTATHGSALSAVLNWTTPTAERRLISQQTVKTVKIQSHTICEPTQAQQHYQIISASLTCLKWTTGSAVPALITQWCRSGDEYRHTLSALPVTCPGGGGGVYGHMTSRRKQTNRLSSCSAAWLIRARGQWLGLARFPWHRGETASTV